jgi:hypothetical protein
MRRKAQFATTGVLAATLGVLASCATLSGGARDTFSQITACSPDRVSVVARPDLSKPEPSSSPELLPPVGHGRHRHQPSQAPAPHDCDMFEATGCGQLLLLCCGHPWAIDSNGARVKASEKVDCSRVPPPAPSKPEDDAGPDATPPTPASP